MKTETAARRSATWIGLLLLCAGCTTSSNQPNIVIFLADDLGWEAVGFNGGPYATPQIDRLAQDGVRFEQFYVQPLCSPTRAALLTGRYPIRYGLQVGVVNVWDPIGLPLEERTLAEALKDAGYATAIVGKWHLGVPEPAYVPTRRGFDRQYGSYSANIDYYTHEKLGALDWHRNDRPLVEEGHATELTAREAIRIIEAHDDTRPLFLYVPFQAAHEPRTVPTEYLERFADVQPEKPRMLAAMLAQMDDAVGRIVGALERRGMLDESIVIFASDNGAGLSKGDLRGGKGGLYEGGVRVPAALMWRGNLEGGRVLADPVHITDLYPTLLGLAGATPGAESLDGFDLWPTLAGTGSSPRDEILLHMGDARAAMRVGDLKLIAHWPRVDGRLDRDSPPEVELFDLGSDPYETNDLSGELPIKVEEILSRLEHYRSQAVAPLKGARSAPPPGFRVPVAWGPNAEGE
jgi:arylsulfatase A-like enzyme